MSYIELVGVMKSGGNEWEIDLVFLVLALTVVVKCAYLH